MAAKWLGDPIADAHRKQPCAHVWQPIETAPKDGTRLLLLSDHGHIVNGSWNTGGAYFLPHWMGGVHEPTHWMPEPAPPEAQ